MASSRNRSARRCAGNGERPDLGAPNCFVPLDASTSARKLQYLATAFASQRDKRWFSAETFKALMRLRGLEVPRTWWIRRAVRTVARIGPAGPFLSARFVIVMERAFVCTATLEGTAPL